MKAESFAWPRGAAALAFLVALLPAPAWPCHVSGNEVLNCGFPLADGMTSWDPAPPFGTCTQDNTEGSSELGNASCASSSTGMSQGITLRQCVDNIDSPGVSYGYGFDARVASGSGVSCTMTVDAALDATGCGGANQGSSTSNLVPTGGSFTQSDAASFTPSASAGSIFINVTCSAAAAFTVHIDDVFLGAGLMPVELQSFDVE